MHSKSSARNSRRKRLWWSLSFAYLAGFLAFAGVGAGLAWTYVYALTHPDCQPSPTHIASLPAPEEVWLETRDGLRLRSWYYPSRNNSAIIALGGMDGALGEHLPPVEFLIQQGYGVIQLDSRACAQPAAVVTLGAKEMLDAEAALEYLEGLPDIKSIGVFGFSMGASTALRVAARHSEIKAVVAEGGYFNLGDDFIEPDLQLSLIRRAFLYTIAGSYWLQSGVYPWEVSPIDDLPRISPRPVFLIYGEGEVESGRAQVQFAAAQEPKAIWIVPGGRHGTNYATSPEEYRRRVIEFFQPALDRE